MAARTKDWISVYRIWVNYPEVLVKILQKIPDNIFGKLYRSCHFMRDFMDDYAEQIGRNIFSIKFFFDFGRIKYRHTVVRPPITSDRVSWIPKLGTAQKIAASGTFRIMFDNLPAAIATQEEIGGFGPWFLLRHLFWRIGINIRSNFDGRRIFAAFLQCEIEFPEISVDVDAQFSIITTSNSSNDALGKFAHSYSKDDHTFGFDHLVYLDQVVSTGIMSDKLILELKMRTEPVQNVLTPLEYQNRIEELIQKANNCFVKMKDVNLAIKHIKKVILYCADRNPGYATKAQIEWHLDIFRDYQREIMNRT